MKTIGININRTKDRHKEILNLIENIILKYVPDTKIIVLDKVKLNLEKLNKVDMVISLGGDGTILSTSRLLKDSNVPIFGVNIGNLGFLTSSDLNGFEEEFIKILKGNYKIEDRLLLNCQINEKEGLEFEALNDIVLSKGTLSRIVKFYIYIDDSLFTSFKADGIIVATPTGSTAYSLSAGGPIMCPTLKVVSITPICPHMLGMRTLVIDSASKIVIKPEITLDNLFLTIDGQNSKEIVKGDFISIEASKNSCKLMRTEDYDYFSILRDKIINK